MKYFIAIALIAAVASAGIVKPTQVSAELAELEQIIAAINSPSTDPATAVALEAMLHDILGTTPETSPIAVGPAIVESSPISVGPAFIDFPLPDGGEGPTVLEPVQPSPVVIGEIPAGSSPLVQIIVNVNQADSAVVGPAPVVAPEAVVEGIVVPGPVNVVESPDVSPVIVEPVQVVNPVVIEPIAIGTPIIPAPAVVLPETLN